MGLRRTLLQRDALSKQCERFEGRPRSRYCPGKSHYCPRWTRNRQSLPWTPEHETTRRDREVHDREKSLSRLNAFESTVLRPAVASASASHPAINGITEILTLILKNSTYPTNDAQNTNRICPDDATSSRLSDADECLRLSGQRKRRCGGAPSQQRGDQSSGRGGGNGWTKSPGNGTYSSSSLLFFILSLWNGNGWPLDLGVDFGDFWQTPPRTAM
jgi:hypothetical protein